MPKIIYNPKKCINCGSCVSICSILFKISNKKDKKVLLIDGKLNKNSGNFERKVRDVKCAKDAVDVCPVQVITIKT